uniref:Peptidyl arginine deiminase, type II n=1 Tax=Takifugu rubripes TaxID=31033 RepID=A0A674NI20_TAKRU
MAHNRTLGLYCDQTISVVYVVGSDLLINSNRCAPPGTDFFSVKCTPNVQYIISPPPQETSHLSPLPLSGDSMIIVRMSHASDTENESKLSVRYYGSDKKVLGTARLYLTALEISLDVDADRDGVVERNNPNKGSWKWGPNGHGAVLLVNCDCERTYWKTPDSEKTYISKVSDLKDMSLMVLRTRGPAKLPNDYKLTLHISQSDAESVRVFRSKLTGKQNVTSYSFTSFLNDYPLVLSREVLSQEVPYLGGDAEINFYVEGLRFTDKDFNGLISVNLSVLEPISERVPETPIFTDKVVFRVAPWIMTPNTLDPLEVFVCSTADNYQFLKGMKNFVGKSGHKLKICYEYMNRGDRWMQVKGPDFGYVTREPDRENISSLDSFGNLEVSPPVTVNGKNYPFGRILIGVAFPTATKGRNMTKVVQDFLWAQKVQDPIALFSDWLYVGHVDEFMTFVPAPDRKGFRLLLASPDAAFKLFRRLQSNGHGEAKLFEESITVDEILNDDSFHVQNMYVQSCINWNRDVLKRELGLEEEDIIDLPILFKLVVGTKHQDAYRALAYYPDMVNMIVLGKHLGIPKPFGPKVDGHCALEAEMCSLMEGLGLKCTFIDDFASYHKLLGEVHCGSNVRRGMFDFKWWNLEM